MPTKTTIDRKRLADSVIHRRRHKLPNIGEEDEVALREGLVEDMVRELVRETLSHIERYLDE